MKQKQNRTRGRPSEIKVSLKRRDALAIRKLLKTGRSSARVFKRATLLSLMDSGLSANQAAVRANTNAETARRIAKKYALGGLDAALYEGARPGKRRLLRVDQEQSIVALACTTPPTGVAQWSALKLAKEAVKRGIVLAVSHDTILRLLQAHDLKPWREKNVVRRRS